MCILRLFANSASDDGEDDDSHIPGTSHNTKRHVHHQTIYNHVRKSNQFELDVSKTQVWIFDNNYVCVHGSTESSINVHKLNKYLGKNINDVDDDVMRNIVLKASRTLETVQTVYYNENMLYVESTPMYYDNDPLDIFAMMFIAIPYKQANKYLEAFNKNDKSYTHTRLHASPKTYIFAQRTRNVRDCWKNTQSLWNGTFQRLTISRLDKNLHVNGLDMNSLNVFIVGKDFRVIYGTSDPNNDRPLEYYIGRHIDDIEYRDKSVGKVIHSATIDCLNGIQCKRHVVIKGEAVYMETKVLFNYNQRHDILGALILLARYKRHK